MGYGKRHIKTPRRSLWETIGLDRAMLKTARTGKGHCRSDYVMYQLFRAGLTYTRVDRSLSQTASISPRSPYVCSTRKDTRDGRAHSHTKSKSRCVLYSTVRNLRTSVQDWGMLERAAASGQVRR